MAEELKKFTAEELKQYNGENGQPAYVAYKDRVIDVTNSKMWRNGSHMKRHQAGAVLTAEIGEAPHDIDVLDRFPQIGILIHDAVDAQSEERQLPRIIAFVIERFPFFERHPHPMTAHFPITLMIFAPLFTLLYLITGVRGFDFTALSCLGAGVLFSLITISTGFFTWWLNYFARPMTAIIVKISVSSTMTVVGLITFIWRLKDPTVLEHIAGINILYLILVLSLLPMIAVVGWFGASLTFPMPKKK